jgi:hypothetical protein
MKTSECTFGELEEFEFFKYGSDVFVKTSYAIYPPGKKGCWTPTSIWISRNYGQWCQFDNVTSVERMYTHIDYTRLYNDLGLREAQECVENT